MKTLRKHWPWLAALGALAMIFVRPAKAKGERNPGGRATSDELAYTDYLTTGDGTPRLDFDAWVTAGKPRF